MWRFVIILFHFYFFDWRIVERIYGGNDSVEKTRFLVTGYYVCVDVYYSGGRSLQVNKGEEKKKVTTTVLYRKGYDRLWGTV